MVLVPSVPGSERNITASGVLIEKEDCRKLETSEKLNLSEIAYEGVMISSRLFSPTKKC